VVGVHVLRIRKKNKNYRVVIFCFDASLQTKHSFSSSFIYAVFYGQIAGFPDDVGLKYQLLKSHQ